MELEHVRNLGDSSFNSSFLDEEKKPREWNDPIFEKKKKGCYIISDPALLLKECK